MVGGFSLVAVVATVLDDSPTCSQAVGLVDFTTVLSEGSWLGFELAVTVDNG